MLAVYLHYVLVDLLAISDLVWAKCTSEGSTSPGYKPFEYMARRLSVRIVMAEDVTQTVQRGGTATILYVIRRRR